MADKTRFVVSDSPDKIELTGEETLSVYDTARDAAVSITSGWHGEYGQKFILAVETTLVATYDRPWAIVRKEDHAAGTDPEAAEPTGPTDNR
jgi:hypothetical protein